ncbi:hypothetical protein GGE45_006294 [Rhizobium aethiopicum]|nr:hypothetical protein [Rhizobium aethiopicum]
MEMRYLFISRTSRQDRSAFCRETRRTVLPELYPAARAMASNADITRERGHMTATKGEFFNPAKLSSRDKAEATDQTARAIIAAEASARDKKTEKLRALRLQQAAETADAAPAPVKKRRSTAKAATRRS